MVSRVSDGMKSNKAGLSKRRATRGYGKYGRDVKIHATEWYSPPRVNSVVEQMGMILGLLVGFSVIDPEDEKGRKPRG